ncbi:hypothetical protein CIPAW_16G049400 [Carya illinoinensis]|uniref:Uncharacterized protein n=1 Tax=Carya illinoinensis TaxID=32201 RepID=A0A8T1N1Y5_CARIL|nr:hypothetical protein CIPAW_16G049400 [Carya illinoinensis]
MTKPSPLLGLLTTRLSHDFTSNKMATLKFSPLQLIRYQRTGSWILNGKRNQRS